jgi:hypothetical protein
MSTPQDPHAKDAQSLTTETLLSPQTRSVSESLQQVASALPAIEQQLTPKPNTSVEDGVLLILDEADALYGKRSEVKDSQNRFGGATTRPQTETPVVNDSQPLHHNPPK